MDRVPALGFAILVLGKFLLFGHLDPGCFGCLVLAGSGIWGQVLRIRGVALHCRSSVGWEVAQQGASSAGAFAGEEVHFKDLKGNRPL